MGRGSLCWVPWCLGWWWWMVDGGGKWWWCIVQTTLWYDWVYCISSSSQTCYLHVRLPSCQGDIDGSIVATRIDNDHQSRSGRSHGWCPWAAWGTHKHQVQCERKPVKCHEIANYIPADLLFDKLIDLSKCLHDSTSMILNSAKLLKLGLFNLPGWPLTDFASPCPPAALVNSSGTRQRGDALLGVLGGLRQAIRDLPAVFSGPERGKGSDLGLLPRGGAGRDPAVKQSRKVSMLLVLLWLIKDHPLLRWKDEDTPYLDRWYLVHGLLTMKVIAIQCANH